MQTINLSETFVGTVYLEQSIPGEPSRRLDVFELPFTVGRNESCNLAVPSNRVSRDHAVLRKEGDSYLLKDLGSTNGTFVNGERITEVRLRDGDLVVFGDAEYCFRASNPAVNRRTVTHVLPSSAHAGNEEAMGETHELLNSLRSRQEALLHLAIRLRFQVIVDLKEHHTPVAYEALIRPAAQNLSSWEEQLDELECRLNDRRLELTRLLAVEQARTLTAGTDIFLRLQTAEVGADGITQMFSRWQELTGTSHRLVAAIPDSAVADIAYFRTFINDLRSRGIGIAYYDFATGAQQLAMRRDFAPDYVQLTPALTRGIDRSTQRQRQLSELFTTARTMQTRVIATGIHTEHEASCCLQIGGELGAGELFGSPGTIDPYEG